MQFYRLSQKEFWGSAAGKTGLHNPVDFKNQQHRLSFYFVFGTYGAGRHHQYNKRHNYGKQRDTANARNQNDPL